MRLARQWRGAAWVCVVLLVVPLAVAWAECGHCAVFSGGSCPAQFCCFGSCDQGGGTFLGCCDCP